MKVAYIFATSRHSVSYVLGKMILPQLEENRHGVDVAGMFFFEDNNFVLVKGNPIGERLHNVAKKKNIQASLRGWAAGAILVLAAYWYSDSKTAP